MPIHHRIPSIIYNAAKAAGVFSKKTVDVDYKLLVKVGWKPGAARGISHGIFAGSIGNYLKDDVTPDRDALPPKKKFNGAKTYSKNQTRYRQFSNRGRGCYPYRKSYQGR